MITNELVLRRCEEAFQSIFQVLDENDESGILINDAWMKEREEIRLIARETLEEVCARL